MGAVSKRRSGQWMATGAIIIFIFGLFLLAYVFTLQGGSAVQKRFQTVSSFVEARFDRIAQDIRASLLRPALLFGTFSAANELASHGGYSEDAVSKIKNINGVALWTAVTDIDTEAVEDKIPFLYWRDQFKVIGQEAVEIEVPLRTTPFEKLTLAPLREGLIEVFFLKPGTVSIECVNAKCTPTSINSDGFHTIKIQPTPGFFAAPFKMKIVGSTDGVAMIRQVVLSTLEGAADMANAALAKNIDAWMGSFKQSPLGAVVTPAPLAASFAESKDGSFMNVTAFAPAKIVLGKDTPVSVATRGYVEENVTIRYWKLYDIAKRIAEKYEENAAAIQTFVTQALAQIHDKITDKQYGSGSCTPWDCGTILERWGQERPEIYNNEELKEFISAVVKSSPKYGELETFWKQFENDGIKIESQVTARPLEDKDNKKPWGDKLWNQKSRSESVTDTSIASSCRGLSPPPKRKCGKEESWLACSGREVSQRYRLCQATCEYEFGANYDIKITITDTTYKIYDPASNSWTELRFTFDLEWLFKDLEIANPFTDQCTPSDYCDNVSPSGSCISVDSDIRCPRLDVKFNTCRPGS